MQSAEWAMSAGVRGRFAARRMPSATTPWGRKTRHTVTTRMDIAKLSSEVQHVALQDATEVLQPAVDS